MERRKKIESGLEKAIICDIDGTLALLGNRDKHDPTTGEDTLNYPIANILEVYDNQKELPVRLILMTGREERFRDFTETWLRKHGIAHYTLLLMRKTGDYRKDYTVKRELYEEHVRGTYHVLFVLEDRDQAVKMWRKEGLTCLQVDYGNF